MADQTSNTEQPFISSDEVARRLRLTRRTVNNYFKKYADILKPMKIGALMHIENESYPLLLEALRNEANKPHGNAKITD